MTPEFSELRAILSPGESEAQQAMRARIDALTPDALSELVLQLEQDAPYLRLVGDEGIAQFFGRVNLPVHTGADFSTFNAIAYKRMNTLAEKSERARRILDQTHAIASLRSLPSLIEEVNGDFQREHERARNAYCTILESLYSFVSTTGFRIDEEGAKAKEPYPGHLMIAPNKTKGVDVHYTMPVNNAEWSMLFNLGYMAPRTIHRTTVDIPRLLRKPRQETREEISLGTPEFKLVPRRWPGDSVFSEYWVNDKNVMTPGEYFDKEAQDAKARPDLDGVMFQAHMETMFRLPTIMRNFTLRARDIYTGIATNDETANTPSP